MQLMELSELVKELLLMPPHLFTNFEVDIKMNPDLMVFIGEITYL